jgi:hypothetical protein
LCSCYLTLSKLEEVISGELEVVAEHVLIWFWSRELQISLEPVLQGLITETEEAARPSVQDTMKLMAMLFECQPEDVLGSPFPLVTAGSFAICK